MSDNEPQKIVLQDPVIVKTIEHTHNAPWERVITKIVLLGDAEISVQLLGVELQAVQEILRNCPPSRKWRLVIEEVPQDDGWTRICIELDRMGMDDRNMVAGEFQVAESTVRKWSLGVARPHPKIQKHIIEFVDRKWCNGGG